MGYCKADSLEVVRGDHETGEHFLKRFLDRVRQAGLLRELKSRRHFVPKQERVKLRRKEAARRDAKGRR